MEHKPEDLITADLAQIRAVVEGCKYLSLDFETIGVNAVTMQPIGVGLLTDVGCCYVPLVKHTRESGMSMDPVDPEAIKAIMSPVLQSVPVIGHNIIFECHACTKLGWGVPAHPICTLVGFWLLSEDSQLGLKEVSSAVVGQDLPDFNDHRRMALDWKKKIIDQFRENWVKEEKALHGRKITEARREVATVFPYPNLKDITALDIPLEWLGVYCIKDCAYTGHLWLNVIRPTLAAEGLLGYFFAYEMPFLKVLYQMEQAGFAIDAGRFTAIEQELTAKIADIESQIFAVVGHQFNLDSHQQKSEVLFKELGFQPSSIKTDSGAPALNEASLKELHETYAEQTMLFQLLLDRTEAVKLREFATRLPGEAINGRIHANFKQTGTATGRLASSDPNLQNVPKTSTMRAAFVAPPGYRLVKADLGQAELRVVADLAGDIAYLSVFRQNGDPHQMVVNKLGLTGPNARRFAKTLSFGQNYGMSSSTYRKRLLWEARIVRTQKECDEEFAKFAALHSEIQPWKERVWKEAKDSGFIVSRLGRRRRLPDIVSDDRGEVGYAERQAANFLVQGTVADAMKVAMISMLPELEMLGARMVGQVHDECLVEVPEDVAYEAARIVKWHMENTFKDILVPLIADVGVGMDWYNADDEKNKVK